MNILIYILAFIGGCTVFSIVLLLTVVIGQYLGNKIGGDNDGKHQS